ncbi:MAG: aminotransferase class III-fold pyridoxal phosphate-dependent enzyme [Alphaproteobacteria bacterium]|nr:aminotransferase class III-fold pyridoxal phosphate-dependent enzyme [Alphaproteobacteria bacterium]
MPLTNMQMRDVQSVLHPYTNLVKHRETGPVTFVSGRGVHVFDDAGKDYIEAMAGLWCTALGWGENELAETAERQMKQLAYGHLFAGRSHEPAIALAEKLKEMAPFANGKVFFANSGSEANDTQIKLFWYANNARGETKRKKIISRVKAYHGVTLASASLTMLPANHRSFDLPFDFVRFADCPHYYRNAEAGESEVDFAGRMAANLDRLIQEEGPETIAAMIAEPLQGAGGVILPPKGYFDAVQKVLSRYGIALIDDEVITGFCRTGNWFGAETFGMRPQSVTLAKALSSAYLPISAVIVSPEYVDLIEAESGRIGTFGHGYTYSGHPVAAAVALKTLEIYETRAILDHVRRVSPHFQKKLSALGLHPLVGEASGVGLIGGIELVADKPTKKTFDAAKAVAATVAKFAEGEGVIVRPLMGDRIAICPPLIIAPGEIDELFARLTRGLDKGLDWAVREGLLAP